MVPGPGVDIVMDAAKLLDRFDPESFDVVLSTEMVEHVRDWRSLFNDLKRLCAPNGIIVLTTRSRGFAYHGFPYDFWRYELSDMELVFSDFRIELLEQDPSDHQPGVFVKARRCESTQALDLSPIALYSVCTEDRRLDLSDLDLWRFRAQRRLMQGRRELTKATSTVKDRIPQRVKDPIKQRIGRGG
jgi:SAM-dependent methyltransferase